MLHKLNWVLHLKFKTFNDKVDDKFRKRSVLSKVSASNFNLSIDCTHDIPLNLISIITQIRFITWIKSHHYPVGNDDFQTISYDIIIFLILHNIRAWTWIAISHKFSISTQTDPQFPRKCCKCCCNEADELHLNHRRHTASFRVAISGSGLTAINSVVRTWRVVQRLYNRRHIKCL